MGKKSPKKGYYYCNTDKMYKPIPKGYKVRDDGILVKEGWSSKYKKSIDCNNPKGFSQKAHCQGKKKRMTEESNPRIPRKKGQPAKSKKHSDLYTDEDPKGTIHGLGFKDVATAKASVAKIRKSSRKHAHKIQAAIAMEQRARVMGKTAEAAIFRKYINSMKKKTKAMNEEKKGDHEYEMIRRQTDNIMVAAKKIKKRVGDGEGDVKAWVQSKITKAADYLDTAADYMTDKEEVKEGSLHKWFKGSKSKDGKGGWVNVVTGGTCASDEPGEGTPKCVSSAKRASMSKKERLSAARRKKKADPNQQSKRGAAKPTYVATDKPKKKKMKEEFISLPLQLEVPQSDAEFRLGLMFRESLEQDRGMLFIFEDTDYHSFHMKNTFIPLDIAFINEEGRIESIKELSPHSVIPVYPDGKIRYAIEVNRGWFAENNVVVGDAILEEGCEQCGESCDDCECECHNTITEVKDRKGKGSGKKDACYHKVKSRYSVWPSAYASGALVKCRKVGAANWGNSRKEEVEYETKVYKTPHYRWRDALAEHHRKDEDGNTIPHEDDIKEGHYGSAVNKIPAELDKAVALHKSQAERLRASDEFKNDAGGAANKIPAQLDKAVAMHEKQAKQLRAAGVGDDKNCGCGQKPCKTYGKKKEVKKEEFSDWRQELDEKCWKGYEKKGMKTMFGKRYPNCVKKTKKEELEVETSSLQEKEVKPLDVLVKTATGSGKKIKDTGVRSQSQLDKIRSVYVGASYQPEGELIEKKMTKKDIKKRDEIADAISTKDMKDRYGDKNVKYAIATKIVMDKKKKKKKKKMNENIADEALLVQDWNKDDIKFTEIQTVDVIKPKKLNETPDRRGQGAGYKMTDDEFRELQALRDRNFGLGGKLIKNKQQNQKLTNNYMRELSRRSNYDEPHYFTVDRGGKGRIPVTVDSLKRNFPNHRVSPSLTKDHYDWRSQLDDDVLYRLGEDWQKVNRKDKTDGLSKKAVKAYRRENPGSKLKTAVTKDPKKLKKGSKDAKRRLSFCRRMKGMKKRLTSAKTARDPDSRINKALRRWNC